MKKTLFCLIGVIMFWGLLGCSKQKNDNNVETIEVKVSNQLTISDIWIIPDTENNRNTTLWGTATIAKIGVEKEKSAKVIKADNNYYLIKVIDEDKMYYSSDGVNIENNNFIIIKPTDEAMSAICEVYDSNGSLIASYSMFVAKL